MKESAVGAWNSSGIGAVRMQLWVKLYKCTGLLEIIVRDLTTRHAQYTRDYHVDVCRITNGAYRAPLRYVTRTWSDVITNC
jgi:hypothetical protein